VNHYPGAYLADNLPEDAEEKRDIPINTKKTQAIKNDFYIDRSSMQLLKCDNDKNLLSLVFVFSSTTDV